MTTRKFSKQIIEFISSVGVLTSVKSDAKKTKDRLVKIMASVKEKDLLNYAYKFQYQESIFDDLRIINSVCKNIEDNELKAKIISAVSRLKEKI